MQALIQMKKVKIMTEQRDPTDIWAWIYEDRDRFIEQGGQHQTIVENFGDFLNNYDNNHIASEFAIAQALEAAKETGELKWQLLLRHWRLQLWYKHEQLKRALPEAIDLLSLATDPRVRDVPQRICAYNDIVECYANMDAVGYHQEITENALDILSQLPKSHNCATCARSNLASTAAAVGKFEEAEQWVSQTKSVLGSNVQAGSLIEFGNVQGLCGKLDESEASYLEARQQAGEKKERGRFISATLGLAQVYLEKKDIQKAYQMIENAQQHMKFHDNEYDVAKLAKLEGLLAVAVQDPQRALNFLQRAAQMSLGFGSYRYAAETALYAAEVARDIQSEMIDGILDIAAQAVGCMPPTSTDVYQKLASFDRQPVDPTTNQQGEEVLSVEALDKKELQTLQHLLREHIEQHQYSDVCLTLYRLARWHSKHDEMRAAVDYLIGEAALERVLTLSHEDREDAIDALRNLRENLPEKTVEAALTAATNGLPSWLLPLFPAMLLSRWRWILRAIEAEIANLPFVEPEPDPESNDSSFQSWLEHTAGMTALILRFYQRCDPAEFALWAEAMDDSSRELDEQRQKITDPQGQEELKNVISLVQGFAAITRGVPLEEVKAQVLPSFTGIIVQMGEVAERPVWFHPGSTPIDFLVEQAAQKAVSALRHYDEERPRRLKNLALRYKLMNMDLREEEPLLQISRFLDALRELVLLDGKQLPMLEQPLDAPFDSILVAVFESGQMPESASEQ